ncbi:MAG TPA: rhomboid family intramembrane serine protease [Tepidisphaeraceae bacterium]|jgi:membrane associated rhomboid family serine protease
MGWQDRGYNRDESGGIPPVQFRLPPFTRLTAWIIGINLALFLLKISDPAYRAALEWGALRFGNGMWWQVWRWVTCQYLHANAFHVIFNMLAVYFFLPTLELRWGWRKAFVFYTLGGIAAGLLYLAFVAATGQWTVPAIGASGATFAIMGAVALFYPERQLILFLFPVPIRWAVALFAVVFALSSVVDGDLADAAHLGGLGFGFFAPWLAGPYLRKQQRRYEQYRDTRAARAEVAEQNEIDRILAKVSSSGMQSLTRVERRTLAKASDRQKARDRERATRRQRV